MAVLDMEATGVKIRESVLAAGLNAGDIAERMGFTTRNAVYRWFKGEAMPTLDNLVALADILDVSVDTLLVTRLV